MHALLASGRGCHQAWRQMIWCQNFEAVLLLKKALLRYEKLEDSKRRLRHEEQPIQLSWPILQKAFMQAHSTTCRAPGIWPLVQLLQEFASTSDQQLLPLVSIHLSLPIKCTRTAIQFPAQQSGSSPGVRFQACDAYMLPLYAAPMNDKAKTTPVLILAMQNVTWAELLAWLRLANLLMITCLPGHMWCTPASKRQPLQPVQSKVWWTTSPYMPQA